MHELPGALIWLNVAGVAADPDLFWQLLRDGLVEAGEKRPVPIPDVGSHERRRTARADDARGIPAPERPVGGGARRLPLGAGRAARPGPRGRPGPRDPRAASGHSQPWRTGDRDPAAPCCRPADQGRRLRARDGCARGGRGARHGTRSMRLT